jgi:hypothetical protein
MMMVMWGAGCMPQPFPPANPIRDMVDDEFNVAKRGQVRFT